FRGQSLRNPAYQTPPTPRRSLPLFPIPTFLSGAIYEADKAVVKKILGLGRRGGPRDTVIVGVWAHSGRGGAEAACQAGMSGKRSGSEGGGRAERGAGGSIGRPRWPRILRSTSAASIVAMTDMRPPQRGHARTSRSKTRRIKSAHFQSRGFSGGFAFFASLGFSAGAVPETSA